MTLARLSSEARTAEGHLPSAPARRPSSTSVNFCWNGRSPSTLLTWTKIGTQLVTPLA